MYGADATSRRRTTQFAGQGHSSTVTKLLGNDLVRRIQSSSRDSSRGRGVNIEVLLEGAEKLCVASNVPGSKERVATIRSRHQHITGSISLYEGRIKRQASSSKRFSEIEDGDHFDGQKAAPAVSYEVPREVTDEDLEAEEALIKELEARKRSLESRVVGMEKDLGRLRE